MRSSIGALVAVSVAGLAIGVLSGCANTEVPQKDMPGGILSGSEYQRSHTTHGTLLESSGGNVTELPAPTHAPGAKPLAPHASTTHPAAGATMGSINGSSEHPTAVPASGTVNAPSTVNSTGATPTPGSETGITGQGAGTTTENSAPGAEPAPAPSAPAGNPGAGDSTGGQ